MKKSRNKVVIGIIKNNKYHIALVDEEKMNDYQKKLAADFYLEYSKNYEITLRD